MSGRFVLITLSQREGERREVRRRGRFVQFAISSHSHLYRFVKMYINTLIYGLLMVSLIQLIILIIKI